MARFYCHKEYNKKHIFIKREEAMEQDNSPQQTSIVNQPEKHHKKWPWVVLAILAVLVFVPVIIAGYFGAVPGVSNIMGAKKAKDLGVVYTDADFESYKAKTGVQFADFANAPSNPDKPGKKVVFAEPKQMDVSLSQEEITAAINKSGWLWLPLSNTQVKFNDGVVEVSGNLQLAHIKEFIAFIGGVNYSNADVDQAVSWANKLFGGAPVYIKANASVSNGVLSLQVVDAKLGRFSVPLNNAQQALQAGTNNALARTAGLSVGSATISTGKLNFSGTAPTLIYIKRN